MYIERTRLSSTGTARRVGPGQARDSEARFRLASLLSDLPYFIVPSAVLLGEPQTPRSDPVKKTHQGAAIAVVAIGILVCIISAGVLTSELRKERAARERLEQETAKLRQEVESLRKTPTGYYLFQAAKKPLAVEVR